MKKLFLAAIIPAFFACNNKAEENTNGTISHDSHELKEIEPVADDTTSVTASSSNDLVAEEEIEQFKTISDELSQKLVSSYLQIKEALVKTDGTGARSAAENIFMQLESQHGEGISLIREEIEQIASTGSIQHQREHFNDLSKYIYAMVKSSGAKHETLYRQYCPMAFDNTGAFWLSSSEEIMNPYFGDKMLKCGAVKETIN